MALQYYRNRNNGTLKSDICKVEKLFESAPTISSCIFRLILVSDSIGRSPFIFAFTAKVILVAPAGVVIVLPYLLVFPYYFWARFLSLYVLSSFSVACLCYFAKMVIDENSENRSNRTESLTWYYYVHARRLIIDFESKASEFISATSRSVGFLPYGMGAASYICWYTSISSAF